MRDAQSNLDQVISFSGEQISAPDVAVALGAALEHTLDAAHALMSNGVDRYPGKKNLDLRAEEKRAGERRLHEEAAFNDLWRTVPTGPVKSAAGG